MRYRLKLLLGASAFICSLLAQVASAYYQYQGPIFNVVKTLYVDGNEVAARIASERLSYPYPRLTIGAEGNRWYVQNGYSGAIDEFAIYGKVLDPNRIKTHYKDANSQTNYRNAVNQDAPILYLQFEEANMNNGSTAVNSGTAGSSLNGTYICLGTGPNTVPVAGLFPGTYAADFNGASNGNGTCVDVGDSNKLLSILPVTVEMWIQTTQTTAPGTASLYPRLFQHNGAYNEQRSYGVTFDTNSTSNGIGLIGGGYTPYVNTLRTIKDGAWHHIVAIYEQPGDYNSEIMKDDPCLYINFNEEPPLDHSGNNYWVSDPEVNTIVWIEQTPGSLGMAGRFPGDNGRGAISAANRPYSSGPWPCDPGTYPEGCYQEGAPWGKFSFANTGGANPDTCSSTFELWYKAVNPTEWILDNYFAYFCQSYNAAGYPDTAPGAGRANRFAVTGPNGEPATSEGAGQFRARNGDGWSYSNYYIWPLDGKWHHLVVAYDENEVNAINGPDPVHGDDGLGIKVYLDANLIISDVNGSAGGQSGSAGVYRRGKLGPMQDQMYIGNTGNMINPGYDAYSGYIDEFAIYKGVLSAERIAVHYAAWEPKSCAEMRQREQGTPEGPVIIAAPGILGPPYSGSARTTVDRTWWLWPFDSEKRCKIDFVDFANFALSMWRTCNDPNDPACLPNW
jgi:hypothetical protein